MIICTFLGQYPSSHCTNYLETDVFYNFVILFTQFLLCLPDSDSDMHSLELTAAFLKCVYITLMKYITMWPKLIDFPTQSQRRREGEADMLGFYTIIRIIKLEKIEGLKIGLQFIKR